MTSTSTSDDVNQLDHVAASSLNANVKFRKASSSSKDFSVSTSSSNKELELLNVANLDLGSFEAQVTSSGQSGPPKEVDSPRLYLLYGIVILHMTIFATELLVDFMTHSVLILTDCYHHLFNACNALLLVVSFRISNQSTVKNTFGWLRLEVLGMLTTITFVVALIFSLLIEGLLQLSHLHEISTPTDPSVLVIFGVWSLVANLFYVLTINGVVTEVKYKETTRTERSFSTANCAHPRAKVGGNSARNSVQIGGGQLVTSTTPTNGPSNDSNNNSKKNVGGNRIPNEKTTKTQFCGSLIKGIFGPLLILLTAVIMYFFEEQIGLQLTTIIDPGMGVLSATVLCVSFYSQLKNTFLILMQTVPQHVDVETLKKEMLEKFPILENVHELHIWRLTSTKIVATCHIVLPRLSTSEYVTLFNAIRSHLSSPQYGIAYVTIQPEFSNWTAGGDDQVRTVVTENQCFMKCPKSDDCRDGDVSPCEELTCCAAGNDDLSRVAIHGHSHGGDHHGHSH